MEFKHPYEELKSRAERTPNRDAYGYLKLGSQVYTEFQFLTCLEVFDRVKKYGTYFRSLGLKKGDRLAILSKNRVEWIISDWAAIACGIVTVPLYPQSTDEEINFILEEANVKLLVSDQKRKEFKVQNATFSEIEEAITSLSPEFEPDLLPADEVVSIIYTSGTSGHPKGVLHTAESFWLATKVAKETMYYSSYDHLVSYLPLSHVVERMFVEFGTLYTGATAYFVDRVEKVTHYLPQIRPTIFFSVPRIWDMMNAKIERELGQKAIFAKMPKLMKKLVINPLVKKKLGFDRVRFFISGAAKLHADTFEAMKNLGIHIHEAYGLTETLCISTMNTPRSSKRGSVGQIHKDFVDLKIASDGEILLKAGFHFKGYYKRPEETAAAIQDGWFHTGDVGEVDEEGFLTITDRKKDIFKTSNGKYVSPLPIEGLLKKHPSIQEVMVIGDGRDHCVAVASCDKETSNEEDLAKLLDSTNAGLPPHEQIKSLGCVFEAWTTESGELTPSQKLKRKVVLTKLKDQIDQLYVDRAKIKFFSPQVMREGESRAYSSVQ
jgi:long-chain acyl-CoA synthetase